MQQHPSFAAVWLCNLSPLPPLQLAAPATQGRWPSPAVSGRWHGWKTMYLTVARVSPGTANQTTHGKLGGATCNEFFECIILFNKKQRQLVVLVTKRKLQGKYVWLRLHKIIPSIKLSVSWICSIFSWCLYPGNGAWNGYLRKLRLWGASSGKSTNYGEECSRSQGSKFFSQARKFSSWWLWKKFGELHHSWLATTPITMKMLVDNANRKAFFVADLLIVKAAWQSGGCLVPSRGHPMDKWIQSTRHEGHFCRGIKSFCVGENKIGRRKQRFFADKSKC